MGQTHPTADLYDFTHLRCVHGGGGGGVVHLAFVVVGGADILVSIGAVTPGARHDLLNTFLRAAVKPLLTGGETGAPAGSCQNRSRTEPLTTKQPNLTRIFLMFALYGLN